MIGEELVPSLPETRRPEARPLGDPEAVAAELVVSAVRPLAVRKYERAEGPTPALAARVLEVGAGELGRGRGARRCRVLYSGSLGEPARFRQQTRGGTMEQVRCYGCGRECAPDERWTADGVGRCCD
jgi:hypothetical protein